MYMYVSCYTQSIMIQSKTNNTVIHIFEKESSSFLIEFHTTLLSIFLQNICYSIFFSTYKRNDKIQEDLSKRVFFIHYCCSKWKSPRLRKKLPYSRTCTGFGKINSCFMFTFSQ